MLAIKKKSQLCMVTVELANNSPLLDNFAPLAAMIHRQISSRCSRCVFSSLHMLRVFDSAAVDKASKMSTLFEPVRTTLHLFFDCTMVRDYAAYLSRVQVPPFQAEVKAALVSHTSASLVDVRILPREQ